MDKFKGVGIKNIRYVIFPLIAGISIIALVSLISFNLSSGIIVFTVNGEPVTREEFQKGMEESKSVVFAYFADKYGISESKAFWTNDYNGEVPLEKLKSKVVEDIKKIRVEQILAKQNGIECYINYNNFKKKLKDENIRRKEARNRNEQIYGPVQYEERVFYWYVLGNMAEELKKKLSKSTLAVTDSEVKKYYEENKKLFKVPLDDVKEIVNARLVDKKFNNLISQMIKHANVVINASTYKKLSFI